MWIERNYKDCVRASLYVMQKLRDKICKDTREHYSVIYNGLYERESEKVRDLYFQAYDMEWLDSHWKELTRLLKQRENCYRESERQEITLFFAEYFSNFMSEVNHSSCYAKAAMPELIAAQKQVVEQMILFSDQWEERSNQLKVNLKKHKEHYKQLIAGCQNKH